MSSSLRVRWAVPVTSAVFGLVYLAIGVAHNDWKFGLGGLAAMLVYAAVLLLFGRRSEAIGLLSGDQSDERRMDLQLRVAATTGYVMIVAVVAGAIITLAAQSQYSAVFAGLCALGGASWIGSTIWFSRKG